LTCKRIGNAIVCGHFEPDRKIRDQSGAQFTFEDNPRFGPFITNTDGSIKDKQPGTRASFWTVYQWWLEQGKAIDDDGFCMWTAPPVKKLVWLGGRNYAEEGSDLTVKYGREK
jgi:hypothetical protein